MKCVKKMANLEKKKNQARLALHYGEGGGSLGAFRRAKLLLCCLVCFLLCCLPCCLLCCLLLCLQCCLLCGLLSCLLRCLLVGCTLLVPCLVALPVLFFCFFGCSFFWLHFYIMLGAFLTHFGCILEAFWLDFGQFFLHFGGLEGSWRHLGHIMARKAPKMASKTRSRRILRGFWGPTCLHVESFLERSCR